MRSDQLRQALSLCESKRFLEAESICSAFCAENPCVFDGFYVSGLVQFKQAKLDEAGRYFLQALKIAPDAAQAIHDLGVVWFYQEKFDEALECFQKAIRINPRFAQAHCTLGQFWATAGYFEEARKHCQLSIDFEPNFPPAKEYLGQIELLHRSFESVVARVQAIRSGSGRAREEAGCQLASRELFPRLLNSLGLTGVAVEVGVQRAKFSEHLLRHWKGTTLVSIDPWREFQTEEYVDVANVPQSRHDQFYMESIRRLRRFGARSVIWRLLSGEAASLVDDGSVDFCYLDADHSYEAVRQDLRFWYSKVAGGGVLAGHDYILDGKYSFGRFGVHAAVQEFAKQRDLEVFVTAESDGRFPSWFIVKI